MKLLNVEGSDNLQKHILYEWELHRKYESWNTSLAIKSHDTMIGSTILQRDCKKGINVTDKESSLSSCWIEIATCWLSIDLSESEDEDCLLILKPDDWLSLSSFLNVFIFGIDFFFSIYDQWRENRTIIPQKLATPTRLTNLTISSLRSVHKLINWFIHPTHMTDTRGILIWFILHF